MGFLLVIALAIMLPIILLISGIVMLLSKDEGKKVWQKCLVVRNFDTYSRIRGRIFNLFKYECREHALTAKIILYEKRF